MKVFLIFCRLEAFAVPNSKTTLKSQKMDADWIFRRSEKCAKYIPYLPLLSYGTSGPYVIQSSKKNHDGVVTALYNDESLLEIIQYSRVAAPPKVADEALHVQMVKHYCSGSLLTEIVVTKVIT